MNSTFVYLRKQSVTLLENAGIPDYWAVLIQSVLALMLILLLSWVIGRLGRLLMTKYIPKIVDNSKTKLDDYFLKNNFFNILSYFLFGIIFFWIDLVIASEEIRLFIMTLTGTYFTVLTLILINAFINTIYDIYKHKRNSKKGDIKIYLQLVKVIVFSLGGLIIVSFFANEDFLSILKGLGAMITVLLIVYKDTILGFVAGISLSANKMLEVGDWISVPKHNADGTVIEIGLNAVKVQNWDKTITTIPPYKLTSESFVNWKGMEESGGRRIKRAINIDIDSIHFLSEEQIEKFSNFKLLEKYINEKKNEIKKNNKGITSYYDQRRLTNIGTFKTYLENYLDSSGFVHEEMTFIVRQLQSTEKGLPIEIYFFCNEQAWAKYEKIQADIFDHFFAISSEFNLRIYQGISAGSASRLLEKLTGKI